MGTDEIEDSRAGEVDSKKRARTVIIKVLVKFSPDCNDFYITPKEHKEIANYRKEWLSYILLISSVLKTIASLFYH